MSGVNLCYGAFFKVVSSFKKESINNWQLHNRLMNIEDIPFSYSASYSTGAVAKRLKTGEQIENPFQAITEYANCRQTKKLPIQKSTAEQRFANKFLNTVSHADILKYIKSEVVKQLRTEDDNLAKAIVELLSKVSDSSVPATAEFHIDVEPAIVTSKNTFVNERSSFNIVSLIAGVFHYIVVNCTDNTVGYPTVAHWGSSIDAPNGKGISRKIEVTDNLPDSNTESTDHAALHIQGAKDLFNEKKHDHAIEHLNKAFDYIPQDVFSKGLQSYYQLKSEILYSIGGNANLLFAALCSEAAMQKSTEEA
jgi:tetratricopeptide (TPR) repeat protein